MNQIIQIQLSPDDLKDIVKDAVRDEISSLKQEIDDLVNGRLLSPKQAMELLNIKSYNTIKRMWEDKEITMVIIGGKPKITRESINKLKK